MFDIVLNYFPPLSGSRSRAYPHPSVESLLEVGSIIEPWLCRSIPDLGNAFIAIARPDGIEAGKFYEMQRGFPNGEYIIACVAGIGERFPLYGKRNSTGDEISVYDGEGDSGYYSNYNPKKHIKPNAFGILALPYEDGKAVIDREILRFYLPRIVIRRPAQRGFKYRPQAFSGIGTLQLFLDWEQKALQTREQRKAHIKEIADEVMRRGLDVTGGEERLLMQMIGDHQDAIAARRRAYNRKDPLTALKNDG